MAVCVYSATLPPNCEATVLRGMVQVQVPPSFARVPRPQTLVEIFPLGGYHGPPLYMTTTGPDGFYYFQDIAPGSYQIWINRSAGPFVVQVYPQVQQDVPVIVVNY